MIKSDGPKAALYNNKLVSVQVSSTDPASLAKAKEEAVKSGISIIDLTNCQNILREKEIIGKNEYIHFSKIDWNPSIKIPPHPDDGIAKTNSVSYELFTSKGEKINKDYCKDVKTKVDIPLINTNSFNMTMFQEFNKRGINIYDPNDEYYTNRCIPIKSTDNETSILSRRQLYEKTNTTLTCSIGCELKGIDPKIHYMNCDCSIGGKTQEIGSEIAESFVTAIADFNIEILKCYKTTFKYVNYILKS